MKKRRVLLIAAAAAVVVVILQIVTMMKNWDEGIDSSKESKKEEEVTLTWYVNYSWFKTEWGKNLVSKKITEDTGVNIEFITPKGSESEKLRSMVDTDSLADFVTIGWWETENQEMVSDGQVYALNELAEKYDSDFFEEADEDVVKWYTKEDGNIYGYPSYAITYQDFENHSISSNQNFLVRKDIYEAIGSPDMSTPEGFESAVKKAVEMFPFVEGEELIPIGGDEFTDSGNNSFDAYLQNFLAVPYEKNGVYYDRNTDEEYLRWLKVFRNLGEQGYLKDEIFVDKRSQTEEKIVEGRYFCLFYQNSDILDQEKIIYRENPDRVYMAVEGPRNSKGDNPVLPVPGINGWTVTYISKNCEYPKKAMEFMSYMLSEEGQKAIYLGVEGSMYEFSDTGEPVVKKDILNLLNTDRKKYDSLYGADDAYWMLQNQVMQMKWEYNTIPCITQMKEWTYPYTAYTAQYELHFSEDRTMAAMQENLKRIWAKTLPKLLLAEDEADFDSILEAYKEEREKHGYEEFCQAATELVQKNKEKIGIEE